MIISIPPEFILEVKTSLSYMWGKHCKSSTCKRLKTWLVNSTISPLLHHPGTALHFSCSSLATQQGSLTFNFCVILQCRLCPPQCTSARCQYTCLLSVSSRCQGLTHPSHYTVVSHQLHTLCGNAINSQGAVAPSFIPV